MGNGVCISMGAIMIIAYYFDESGRKITYNLADTEALISVGQMLCNAPIDLEYLILETGVFDLRTFEIL